MPVDLNQSVEPSGGHQVGVSHPDVIAIEAEWHTRSARKRVGGSAIGAEFEKPIQRRFDQQSSPSTIALKPPSVRLGQSIICTDFDEHTRLRKDRLKLSINVVKWPSPYAGEPRPPQAPSECWRDPLVEYPFWIHEHTASFNDSG